MRSLFIPAVRLMNRLKYPEKFLLVGIILALPLGVVLSQYVAQTNLVIDFAAREQDGLQYNIPLIVFLRDVQAHAGMIAASAAGNDGFNTQIDSEKQKKQADIEADIAAVNALFDNSDNTIIVEGAARWDAIKKEWDTIKVGPPTLTRVELYDDLIHEMQMLINVVGNSSNQILDPDIDTYYLIDALINKIPSNTVSMGSILRYSATAAAGGSLSPVERTHLEILVDQIQVDLDAQRTTVDYIVGYNPTLGPDLYPALGDLVSKETALLDLLHNKVLSSPGEPTQSASISTDAYAYYESASRLIASTYSLYDLLTTKANMLLRQRLNIKSAQRNGVVLLSATALTVAIYLFAAFYLAVRGVISELEVTAQQLVKGHIDKVPVLETRDELAEVVVSFNTIAREMLTARDQALEANRVIRESENQLRAILDALPLPMAVINQHGVLRYVNPVAKSQFNLDVTANAESTTAAFALEPDDRIRIQQALHDQKPVQGLEVKFRYANEAVRTGLISIVLFQFAGEAALLAAIVDITDLKEAQEAERKQRDLTEALLDSVLGLTRSLDLDDVVQQILRNLQTVIKYDVANIMIIEDGYGTVIGQQNNVDDDNWRVVGSRIVIKDAYYPNLMYETGQAVIVADISNDPKFVRFTQTLDLKSFLALPIISGQQIIGSINLAKLKSDWFTLEHMKYLKLFALQAGIAIQNAHMYEQASTIAALEERQKLARDLHDSVTQTLFSANTIAEALPQLMNQNHEKVHAYIQDLHQLTRGAMAEMRSLLVELRPEALTQTELGMLLSQLCDVFTGKTQIEVDKAIMQKIRLPADVQIGFYRVAQEALNNIAKHAAASTVGLRLERLGDLVELSIRDNGAGFDPDLVSADHFGLRIMQERADAIKATFIIDSRKKQGTEILLRRQLS